MRQKCGDLAAFGDGGQACPGPHVSEGAGASRASPPSESI